MSTKSGIAKTTVFGLLWLLIYSVFGKGISLISQILLGWFLVKEDFGLWAIAISLLSMTAILRNGGTSQYLIHRGHEYDLLAPNVLSYSLIFNCMAMFVLLLSAPIVSSIYQSQELLWMVILLAAELVLSTRIGILSAKLSIEHRFGTLSRIGMTSGFFRQALTVLFAYCGTGALSFVLPVLMESLANNILFRVAVNKVPQLRRLTIKKFKEIWRETLWIMAGALVVAISWQGDYLIIGLFKNKFELGIYFFSMQLVNSIAVMATLGIETVMLPVFVSLSGDKFRQQQYFFSIFQSVTIISFPVAVCAFLLIGSIVNFLWQGKWDVAIPILEILLFTIPASILVCLGRVALESKGMWRARFMQQGIFGIGSMLVVAITANGSGIESIALFVCIFRGIYSILQVIAIGQYLGSELIKMLIAVIRPIVFSIIALEVVDYLLSIHFVSISKNYQDVFRSLGFFLVISIFILAFSHKQASVIFKALKTHGLKQ